MVLCVLSTNNAVSPVQADDLPMTLKGVVVWYQAEKDLR